MEYELGKEVRAIRMRLDHEQYRRKQSERLNRLWELMRRGASICQAALQYKNLLVALAVHGEEERIMSNWVKQIRYVSMENVPSMGGTGLREGEEVGTHPGSNGD